MWATNLKIVGVVLGTVAVYTLIANKIPQVQSEVPRTLTLGANVPPEQLVQAGEGVFNGVGGCTTCHGLGTRAPNLLTDEKGLGPIGSRCGKREPGKSCKLYLHESMVSPTAFVVPGYEPIMPDMSRQLSPQQIWAVVAFLQSQGGTVDVTAADIPATVAPAGAGAAGAGGGGAAFAGGSTDHKDLIKAGGCLGCHKLGAEGAGIGPDLTHIGSRLNANSIRESILDPNAKVAKGYEKFAGIMPKIFGDQMTAAQLESLVRFLASQK